MRSVDGAVSADRQEHARLVGLAFAIAALGLALHFLSDGIFGTPRNLYNLAVQSSVTAILASGMVLVIASGQIDLSVGSVLGATGMVAAFLQAPDPVGWGWPWPLATAVALAFGAAIGAAQGWWVAWRHVPSFVVTLAGLLIFRGVAFLVTDGRTVAPLAPGYQWLGGGLSGSLGVATSWVLAITAIIGVGVNAYRARSQARSHGLDAGGTRGVLLRVVATSAGILAFVALMNAAIHPGTGVGRGVPAPVLIALGVAGGTAFIARRTRFGRHVFALGSNAAATERAGVRVAAVRLGVFAWMGALAAVGGIVTSARLGAGTNSMGTLAELSAIAAAVVGGTSLRGGVGSVVGALLGALLMQSLENGMVLLGVSSAARQIVIGVVLILAVWVDGGWAARGRRVPEAV